MKDNVGMQPQAVDALLEKVSAVIKEACQMIVSK